MKLIVAGATGHVAGEVLRQAVRMPEITSIVALARKPVAVPEGEGSSKVKSVVIQDYGEYPDSVKEELRGANACIWTVAVTPHMARGMDPADLRRVCLDYTMTGLQTMHDAGPAKPFRFVYMSGASGARDPAKKPFILGDYSVLRGEVENKVLAFAKEHQGVEVCVAKPGFISTEGGGLSDTLVRSFLLLTRVAPTAPLKSVAKAMLVQVVREFEKETLENADLVRLGA